MSSLKIPRTGHHRSISIVEDTNCLKTHDFPSSPCFQDLKNDELFVIMDSIEKNNRQRQLSQHDQKLNIRKKILKMFEQSKTNKPKVKALNINRCKAKETTEKLFVPVLSSRRNNRSPMPNGTSSGLGHDFSYRSGKSHTNSVNISPTGNKKITLIEASYLV